MDIRKAVYRNRHVPTATARAFCRACNIRWEPRSRGSAVAEDKEYHRLMHQRIGALDRAAK